MRNYLRIRVLLIKLMWYDVKQAYYLRKAKRLAEEGIRLNQQLVDKCEQLELFLK